MTRTLPSAARRAVGKRRADPARILVAGAVIAAPFEIWALAAIAGYGLTLLHVVAIALAAVACLRMFRLPALTYVLGYCLGVLIVWGLFQTLLDPTSTNGGRAARNALLFGLAVMTFLGASSILGPIERVGRRPERYAVITFAVICIYAIYQAFARRHMLPLAFLTISNPSFVADHFDPGKQVGIGGATLGHGAYWTRAAATFSEPAFLGRYLAFGFAVALAYVLFARQKLGAVIMLVLTLGALAANQSLNGILAFGVVILVMTMQVAVRLKLGLIVRIGAILMVTLGLAVLLFPDTYEATVERIQILSIEESSGRFDTAPMVWREFKEHPLGVGLANSEIANDVHNGMLLLLLQFGVLGLLLPVLWGVAVVVAQVLLVSTTDQQREERCRLGVSMAFVAIQAGSWVSSGAFYDPFLWAMSGYGIGNISRALTERVSASQVKARRFSAITRRSERALILGERTTV